MASADVGPSDYSFNSVDALDSAYLKHHEVTGKLIYDRCCVSYYGYYSNDSIEDVLGSKTLADDAIKQVYNEHRVLRPVEESLQGQHQARAQRGPGSTQLQESHWQLRDQRALRRHAGHGARCGDVWRHFA